MRLHLKISNTDQIIPFDHQHLLVGTIHKWLGYNEEHGNMSLYSFSRLTNGKISNQGLSFDQGSRLFFSAHDEALSKQLIDGIMKDPSMFYGFKVEEVTIQPTPDFENQHFFANASPILIKRNVEGKAKFYYYTDAEAPQLLKESLLNKMREAGMEVDEHLTIEFDQQYRRASTKLVTYNGIKNRCSWCPVIIHAKTETKAFAWHVGLGNSTGIGFGALK